MHYRYRVFRTIGGPMARIYAYTYKFLIQDDANGEKIQSKVMEIFPAENKGKKPDVIHIVDIYFDTKDSRLFKAGVALRERQVLGNTTLELIAIPKKWERGHYFEKKRPLSASIDPDPKILTRQLQSLLGLKLLPILEPVSALINERAETLLVYKGIPVKMKLDRYKLTPDFTSTYFHTGTTPHRAKASNKVMPVITELKIELELTNSNQIPKAIRGLVKQLKAEKGIKISSKAKIATLLKEASDVPTQPGFFPNELQITFLKNQLSYFMKDTFSNESATCPNMDPEYFHAFRVGLRKSRSILSNFKNLILPEASNYYQGEWRWIMQTLGKAWSQSVFYAKVMDLVPEDFRRNHQADFERWLDMILEEQASGWKEVMAVYQTERYKVARKKSLEIAVAPGFFRLDARNLYMPVAGFAKSQIARFNDEVRELSSILLLSFDKLHDDDIHRLRIEFKKLRYVIETFARFLPPEIVRTDALMDIQESFGFFMDLTSCLDEIGNYMQKHQDMVPMLEKIRELLLDKKEKQKVIIRQNILTWLLQDAH